MLLWGGYTFLDHTQSSSPRLSLFLALFVSLRHVQRRSLPRPSIVFATTFRPCVCVRARACVYARAIFPFVSFKSSRDVFCEIIVVERRNVFSRILHFHARSVAKPLVRSKRIRRVNSYRRNDNSLDTSRERTSEKIIYDTIVLLLTALFFVENFLFFFSSSSPFLKFFRVDREWTRYRATHLEQKNKLGILSAVLFSFVSTVSPLSLSSKR